MTVFASIPFSDRREAGRQLAPLLSKFAQAGNMVVLGLPRGGVPVAAEIARFLRAPLDVLVVRKLGVPGCEELAMGAIATGGIRVWNEAERRGLVVGRVWEEICARETRELERREREFRSGRESVSIRGRTAILVDDGIATGSSMRAALESGRQLGAVQLIAAAPVGSPRACASLAEIAHEVVCPRQPRDFNAVGDYYSDFSQTTDAEVSQLLAEADQASSIRVAGRT